MDCSDIPKQNQESTEEYSSWLLGKRHGNFGKTCLFSWIISKCQKGTKPGIRKGKRGKRHVKLTMPIILIATPWKCKKEMLPQSESGKFYKLYRVPNHFNAKRNCYKKCVHHLKSDLRQNMDHIRILGTETSLLISQTKMFKNLKVIQQSATRSWNRKGMV